MRFQTTLLFVLTASGLAAQTQVKTFFEQLPTLKTAPSGQDLLQATDQIANLPAGDLLACFR